MLPGVGTPLNPATSDVQYGMPESPEESPTPTCARSSFQVHKMSELHSITPDAQTVDAISRMRDARIGCLLVVQNGRLVGLVTERDLINVSAKLLEDFLKKGN